MPGRVNLTVLVGLIIVIVLSFGLSAGAQPDDGAQGDDAQGAESEDNSSGAVPEDEAVREARRELEQLQWKVQAAHGARLNAADEKERVADDIAATQSELAVAKEDRAEAERKLADTASEVYRDPSGIDDLLGILFGAGTFKDLTDRLGFSARLLTQRHEVADKANETEDKLTGELRERQEELQKWETTDAEEEALAEQVLQAEADVQEYLDSLDEGVREQIETDRARQVELDRARGEEILEKLAEEEVPTVVAPIQDSTAPQSAIEKLGEFRDLEREAEDNAVKKVLEAEQARLAVTEQQAEPKAEEDSTTAEPEAGGQQARPLVERVGLDAEPAVTEAERAATEAAKQAEAAEQARRVVEQNAAANRTKPQAVSSKKAELPIEVSDDGDGVANNGDRFLVQGDFRIQPGASATVQDADGTRGTVIDKLNGTIVEGSIDISLTGAPNNVTGGDGVLDTTGKLELVDAAGIDAGLGGVPLGQDVTGAAGLQYADDPLLGGVGGLQYGEDPLLGGVVGGLVGAPVIGVAGLQPKAPVASSGQPGLQPAASAPAPGPISGKGIVAEAMSWLGTPYSYGGTSRSGISCSGLVMMVYGKFGISLPNSPGGQLDVVGPLKSGPAPAGAIVFFSENGSGSPTHVGISNGDGTMTDANIVKGMVGITPIDIVPGYMGWGFPPGV